MAALRRLIFMFVPVVMFLVFFIFLERTFFSLKRLVYNHIDFGCTRIGVVMVIHLENQSRLTFLDAFQVESPVAFPFDIQDFFITYSPGQRMFVITRARNFFFVFIEEFDVNVFAQAIGIDMQFLVVFIYLAAVNAVSQAPVGPIKIPAFHFKVFVLIGRGAIAVAASGKEKAEDMPKRAKERVLKNFIFLSFLYRQHTYPQSADNAIKTPGELSQGKKQDVTIKVLTD